MSSILRPGKLILNNGSVFKGLSPNWQNGTYAGEVVFNTGLTGYVESLTDPSYAGQILTFTYPLIGNYGVMKPSSWESAKIHARGVVVSQACFDFSHASAKQSLLDWLKDQGVPIITGIDTRALTQLIRSHGTMDGIITSTAKVTVPTIRTNLVAEVSIKKIFRTPDSGSKTVILVDCGLKNNILRSLRQFPIRLIQVPYNYDYSGEQFDGVVLSNGPGDPTDCPETVKILQTAMLRQKPIFGICLGTQLMALAAGAKTYKLPFGHRGHNQPVIDTASTSCYITSQNHGYAIAADSLPTKWRVSFRNLNDNSVEGIEHTTWPFFAVQFHPEASPGPTDTRGLFDKFYGLL